VRIAEWKGKHEAMKRGSSRGRTISRTAPKLNLQRIDVKPNSTICFVTVIPLKLMYKPMSNQFKFSQKYFCGF
jgi:hypothetical protein